MAGTDVFPLDPDFTVTETVEEGVLRSRTLGRKNHQRIVAPPLRLFRLQLRQRQSTEKEQVLDWYRRFEAAHFRFDHDTYLVEAGAYLLRSFPVIWAAPPSWELVANEAWDMECQFLEAAGASLPAANYPTFAAGHPFIAVAGADSGADRLITYAGYGFRTVGGAGTVHLDGGASLGSAPVIKTDVDLGLHRVKITGSAGAGSLEVLI